MKTCISCKWCVLNKNIPEFSRCEAPSSYERCAVTGGKGFQKIELCITQRMKYFREGFCSPEALWWEEKPRSKLQSILEGIKQFCDTIKP